MHRRDLLNARFQSLFETSSFPLRNIVWLSCQIGIGIPEDTVLRIYTHSDREAVLPYLFHLYSNQKWSTLIENLFVPHPDLHVRLWTQYFSRLDNHSTLASTCESPLLELHRLEDVRVNDWIESQLDSGEYDDDILKVIIEAPNGRLYEPLWNAVWKHAKHQSNALRALDATTPYDDTPTEVLFRKASAAASHAQRSKYAAKLAQRASKVVFHQANSLCQSWDPDARLLGVQILSSFGSPWHSARAACTRVLLERLRDDAMKVRKAAVAGLATSERARIRRNTTEKLSNHDMTQLNRAWECLVTMRPSELVTTIPHPQSTPIRQSRLRRLGMPQRLTRPITAIVKGKARSSNSFRQTPNFEEKRKRHGSHVLSISLSIGLLITGLATSVKATKAQEKQHHSTPVQVKPKTPRVSTDSPHHFSLRRAHSEVLLSRSDTWYLYHRYPTATSAAYIARGPTPTDRHAPEWKLYSTWLLRLLGSEVDTGKHQRVAQFLSSILDQNPNLANLLISHLVTTVQPSHRDDLATALLRGGLKVKPVQLHPAMLRLAPYPRELVIRALANGWQTTHEKSLLAQLRRLPKAPQ